VCLCFFLSSKANARVKLAKTGTVRTLPHQLLFVLFGCYLCCSMCCLCVNVYCHRVTTLLQLTNISISISESIKILIALVVPLNSIQYVYLKSTWSRFSSRLVNMEGLSYDKVTIPFLKALYFNEERNNKLTLYCAHLFPRGDRCRNVAMYWNKFRNWKQEYFYITWQRLISLDGKLKILMQGSLYRVFHFLLNRKARTRRFIEFLLHFLMVIIIAIIFYTYYQQLTL
jgi:hypothetical protein